MTPINAISTQADCIYWFFLGASYKQLTGTECVNDKLYHEGVDTIDLAKSNCTLNEDCKGVYDDRCDGKAPFFLCSKKAKLTPSKNSHSCVYKKGVWIVLGSSTFAQIWISATHRILLIGIVMNSIYFILEFRNI